MNTENCARLPAMSATEPGFYAVRTRALRREGVTGKRAAVTLRAGRLGIVGEDGGAIWVDPADIAAMRVGYDESKSGKHFHTHIVRRSRPQPGPEGRRSALDTPDCTTAAARARMVAA